MVLQQPLGNIHKQKVGIKIQNKKSFNFETLFCEYNYITIMLQALKIMRLSSILTKQHIRIKLKMKVTNEKI